MRVEIVMPKLGESVTEGTVVRWLKQEGDPIARDEAVLEITTDKIDTDVPAVSAGVLTKIIVTEGQTVAVGQIVGVIETQVEAVSADEPEAPSDSTPDPVLQPSASVGAVQSVAHREKTQTNRFYSPLVRNIAKQQGLTIADLEQVTGTGNGSRVTKRDLLTFLANRADSTHQTTINSEPSPLLSYALEDVTIVPMDGIRKAIAEHMVRSKRVSPHVTQFSEVDLTRVVKYREAHKDAFLHREGFKLTLTPFFISAMVDALRKNPLLNASVDGDRMILWKPIHFGIAVGLEKGVIVPVIHHAEALNFLGIARAAFDLASRAHARKLKPDELQGGTFTLTNPGMYGTLFGTPIISQPQVGIAATGAVKKRVVALDDDTIAIRSMMYLSLTYDHRIVDGLNAARFSQLVTDNLEQFDFEGIE